MYLYKTDNFFHINCYLKSVSEVADLHRFYCNPKYGSQVWAYSADPDAASGPLLYGEFNL